MAKKGKNLQETMAPKILNRKARHDYHVDESFEVGIMLTGPEVKSVRMGRVSLAEAFGRIEPSTNELWILNLDIAPFLTEPEKSALHQFAVQHYLYRG